MIKVNLVPGEILAKARQRQLLLQASVLGGGFGVVLVLASLVHAFGLHTLQNEYSYKQSKLKDLGAIVSKVKELEDASAAVRARLGVIDSLLKGRAFYPLFMSEFARSVPGGVKVTQLSTTSQANGSVKLAISGVAGSSIEVADWMRALQNDGHFSNVELGPVSSSGQGYNFTISTA
ncbi:MAG TPA: PilN domain-containing protein, partial [Elusimicrobiota bacterium]|nr:PilN domain-containing protein [Elusimicrobiota bacterium]